MEKRSVGLAQAVRRHTSPAIKTWFDRLAGIGPLYHDLLRLQGRKRFTQSLRHEATRHGPTDKAEDHCARVACSAPIDPLGVGAQIPLQGSHDANSHIDRDARVRGRLGRFIRRQDSARLETAQWHCHLPRRRDRRRDRRSQPQFLRLHHHRLRRLRNGVRRQSPRQAQTDILICVREREKTVGEGRNNHRGGTYGPQVESEASGVEGTEGGYGNSEPTAAGSP